jgi:hypothetical protein
MSLTVPLPSPRPPLADELPKGPTRDVVRLGRVGLGSAFAYLFVWAVALYLVQVLALLIAHAALDRLGVLESVSSAAAAVLGDDEPAGGVLPALELRAVLPWILIGAGMLSLLWLLASFTLVLLHNAVCTLTGGLRVRVRAEG